MAKIHTTGPCNVPRLGARDRALVDAAMKLIEAHKNRPSDEELLEIIAKTAFESFDDQCDYATFVEVLGPRKVLAAGQFNPLRIATRILNALKTAGAL